MIIDENRWQLIKIDENRYSQLFRSSIFIDFRYQSINCYRLISIAIDFHRLDTPGYTGMLEADQASNWEVGQIV